MRGEIVGFELGELAKKKGYSLGFWEMLRIAKATENMKDNFIDWETPTQSTLQKWLRDVHGKHLSIYRNEDGFDKYAFKLDNPYKRSLAWFDTYEEALEEALKEMLNMLPNLEK